MPPPLPRRVVLTGIGAITPLGPTFHQTFSNLLSPSSASPFRSLAETFQNDPEAKELVKTNPCQVASPVPDEFISPSSLPHRSRFLQFSHHASQAAILSSSLTSPSPTRTGVAIGTGCGSISTIAAASEQLKISIKKVSPHFVPSVLCNSAAGVVSMAFGLQGEFLIPFLYRFFNGTVVRESHGCP